MRLFVAAPLPAPILAAILTQQASYNLPGVRLVPAQNMHLTLHFLGETPSETLPVLIEKLQAIADQQVIFSLTFKETAPGPKIKSPRLVWVRFQSHPAFTTLSRSIQSALNFKPQLPSEFIPHITIARLKKDQVMARELPVITGPELPPFPVTSFGIWQSSLGSPHPHYSILQNFRLKEVSQ